MTVIDEHPVYGHIVPWGEQAAGSSNDSVTAIDSDSVKRAPKRVILRLYQIDRYYSTMVDMLRAVLLARRTTASISPSRSTIRRTHCSLDRFTLSVPGSVVCSVLHVKRFRSKLTSCWMRPGKGPTPLCRCCTTSSITTVLASVVSTCTRITAAARTRTPAWCSTWCGECWQDVTRTLPCRSCSLATPSSAVIDVSG